MEANRPNHEFLPEAQEVTELPPADYVSDSQDLEACSDIGAEDVLDANAADMEEIHPPTERADKPVAAAGLGEVIVRDETGGDDAEAYMQDLRDRLEQVRIESAGDLPVEPGSTDISGLPPDPPDETGGGESPEYAEEPPVFDLSQFEGEQLTRRDSERVAGAQAAAVQDLFHKYGEYATSEVLPAGWRSVERLLVTLPVADGELAIQAQRVVRHWRNRPEGQPVLDVNHKGVNEDGLPTDNFHRYHQPANTQEIRRLDVDMVPIRGAAPDAADVGTDGVQAAVEAEFQHQLVWSHYEGEVGLNNQPVGPNQMEYVTEFVAAAEPPLVSAADLHILTSEIDRATVTPTTAEQSRAAVAPFVSCLASYVERSGAESLQWRDPVDRSQLMIDVGTTPNEAGKPEPIVRLTLTGSASTTWARQVMPGIPKQPGDLVVAEVEYTINPQMQLTASLRESWMGANGDSLTIHTANVPVGTTALQYLRYALRKPMIYRPRQRNESPES